MKLNDPQPRFLLGSLSLSYRNTDTRLFTIDTLQGTLNP